MQTNKDNLYSIEKVEAIIANPDTHWKTQFKEMIISMIASNKNDLLWYANFLSRCEYEFHFHESFVSSIYFNGKNFVIIINPLILGVIHKEQIIAILKHSAGHIINHHFKRNMQENSSNKEIIETAKDIVINGSRELPYIKDLPQTGEHEESPLKAFFYQTLTEKYGIESYETGREFEYYVELMIASQEEEESDDELQMPSEESDETEENNDSSGNNEENASEDESDIQSDTQSDSSEESDEENESSANSGEGDREDTESEMESNSLSQKTLDALNRGECNIDSHDYGEQRQEAVGLDNDLVDSFIDTTLNEMINDSTSFARGFTPSDAMEALSRIEQRKSHKDWRKIFNKKMRNYLTNSLRYREPNKSRQHPIYPDDLDLYGYSPSKKPKIGVVLDVSGSVDDELLIALMSEIQAIQQKYAIKSVTLVQVDAEIKKIEKFGVRDKFIVRHGGGGTIMEPGFNALLKQSSREIPDIIICATDGDIEKEFEEVRIPNKVQVIWLIKQEGTLLFDTSKYPKQQMQVIEFSV